MLGDFPPNSSETRLIPSAAAFMMPVPVAVEPVNEILRTSGWRTRASPQPGPGPGTTLSTPSGRPASAASSASASAVSGVSGEGLRTTVLPQASAGPSFQAAMTSGKFHGTMRPHTPTGSRKV